MEYGPELRCHGEQGMTCAIGKNLPFSAPIGKISDAAKSKANTSSEQARPERCCASSPTGFWQRKDVGGSSS